MIAHVVKSACVVTAVVALAACTTMKEQSMETSAACDNSIAPGVEVVSLPSWFQIMKQVVNGKRTRDILRDPALLDGTFDKIEETLKKAYDVKAEPGETLQDRIERIEQSDFVAGLAGISVRTFLHAVKQTLGPDGRFARQATVITKGKIQAYYFDDGPSTDKNDCLEVLMVTRPVLANATGPVIAYRWTVFANLQAAKRRHDNEPGYDKNDVFPDSDSVPIGEALAAARMAEYKLWAKAGDIEVRKVELSVNNGPFVTLPQIDPLYQSTPESCIDMMFQVYPPRTLPPYVRPPFYCLGRCEHPRIINTM